MTTLRDHEERMSRTQIGPAVDAVLAQMARERGPICSWKGRHGNLCGWRGATLTDAGWLCARHAPKGTR